MEKNSNAALLLAWHYGSTDKLPYAPKLEAQTGQPLFPGAQEYGRISYEARASDMLCPRHPSPKELSITFR